MREAEYLEEEREEEDQDTLLQAVESDVAFTQACHGQGWEVEMYSASLKKVFPPREFLQYTKKLEQLRALFRDTS